LVGQMLARTPKPCSASRKRSASPRSQTGKRSLRAAGM
jgi:hypothetical protein